MVELSTKGTTTNRNLTTPRRIHKGKIPEISKSHHKGTAVGTEAVEKSDKSKRGAMTDRGTGTDMIEPIEEYVPKLRYRRVQQMIKQHT